MLWIAQVWLAAVVFIVAFLAMRHRCVKSCESLLNTFIKSWYVNCDSPSRPSVWLLWFVFELQFSSKEKLVIKKVNILAIFVNIEEALGCDHWSSVSTNVFVSKIICVMLVYTKIKFIFVKLTTVTAIIFN